MIERHNFGRNALLAELRPQEISDKISLLFRSHTHAGIIRCREFRLVLYSQCIDRDTQLLIILNVSCQILRVSRIHTRLGVV
ncbi:hypothetical protein D3C81_2248690 [compost metagenome]